MPTINGDKGSCFAITEPGAGSDARAIRTSARREGDEWVINGEKTFITGGNEADFVMVFAVTDREQGADGGVTCFLVDRDRGWTSTPIDTMGEWGPAALVFDDVRVPHSAILGEEGKGFELAMRWIGKGRYMLPAHALGSCERLVEMGMEWARNRVTFGQPIAERQAIQWMVADSAVEIEALRWLVLTAAWQVDNGIDSRQSQSMAKLFGGVKANEIVDRVLQMHGGMGYTRELPDRAVVSRAAPAAHLRGHRRDPAPHHRPQPAQGARLGARPPRLASRLHLRRSTGRHTASAVWRLAGAAPLAPPAAPVAWSEEPSGSTTVPTPSPIHGDESWHTCVPLPLLSPRAPLQATSGAAAEVDTGPAERPRRA